MKFTVTYQPTFNSLKENSPLIEGMAEKLRQEIQRKLDFIQRRKAENQIQESVQETQEDQPPGISDEIQRKLCFIRQRKAEMSKGPENGLLQRQISNPETTSRPTSVAVDNSLDEMLARIKTLREERKQILQDMSAIKTAFGSPAAAEETPVEVVEECDDDGISGCTGNSSPGDETFSRFSPYIQVEGGKESPTVSIGSRHGRRSVDSGIGSKSVCSVHC